MVYLSNVGLVLLVLLCLLINIYIKYKAYRPDRRLCYTVSKEYLFCTKPCRNHRQTQLLIRYVSPYMPVSRDTIARWFKVVLTRAWIDTHVYKSHSIRRASTSKAKQSSVQICDIIQKAGYRWSNAGTFSRFFHKVIEKATFEDAVLKWLSPVRKCFTLFG